jgi:transposase
MPVSYALISTPPAPAEQALSGGEAPDEALGRSRGGFSTKIHVRAEGHGKPVTFHLTGGERHDSTALAVLLDTGAVRRKRGRPRLRPRRVAGDKAFAGQPSRTHLRSRGIGAVIPTKSNQPRRHGFDREAYRARNRVERLFNRLKQFRRIATRYEKRAQNYLAMLHIAAITLWL